MPKYPDWLATTTTPQPPRRASRFLTRNLANLAHLLAHFNHSHHIAETHGSAWVELLSLLVTVMLTVTCRNAVLLWVLVLVQLVVLLRLPGEMLGGLLLATLRGCIFSAIVVLPSLLFTTWLAAGWWLAKLALVMLEVQLFRHRVSWRALLLALRQLHVPSLFILTLDITVKYSHVLGNSLQSSLEAVWLRSCGQLDHPLQLATNLIGRLYLQSRHNATELYQAMWLRGYTATPEVGTLSLRRQDWPVLAADLVLVGLAVVL
ncbi:CbiQ family ECF transporter T component [Lacticaseibacillus sp. GG6-2]